MKIPFKSAAIAAVVAGMASMSLVWADDTLPETDVTETEVVEVASSVPGDRIAGFFGDFFGDQESSQAVVNGLRDGSIHYIEPMPEEVETETGEDTPETGEAVEELPEVEEGAESNAGMGYGNVMITMALAEQLAVASQAEALEGEMGLTPDESLNEVLRMRQVEGMGWGQIAKDLGVNLGEVISGIRSNRPDMTDKMASRESRQSMRAEKEMMRMERKEKVAKVERVAKAERPEHAERPTKPERIEKPARPEKPQRPERPGK